MHSYVVPVVLITIFSMLCMAEPLHPGRLDPTWQGLGFGVKKEDVVTFLQNRIRLRVQTKLLETRDVRFQEALKREMEKELAQVGTDFVEFTGHRTGWDVSVVRGEFGHNTGEAMLHVQEGKEHFYFFFANGIFYKMVRSRVDVPVAQVVEEAKRVYGAPSRIEYQDEATKTGIRAAEWDQGLLRLRVEDRTRLYQCVVMRWALKDADDKITAEREKTKGAARYENPIVREAIERIERDETYNPVDEILGRTPPPQEEAQPQAPKKKPRKK